MFTKVPTRYHTIISNFYKFFMDIWSPTLQAKELFSVLLFLCHICDGAH